MTATLILPLHNRRLSKLRRRKGMTALEVAIAIGAGLLFLAAAAYGVIRYLDNMRYNTLTRLAGDQMVSVLGQVYGQQGTLASLTTAAGVGIISGMGVNPNTPWGGAWTVKTAGTQNTVQLQYPLGGNQLATQGPAIAANLGTQYPMMTCTFTSPNLLCSYNMAQ